MNAKLEVTADAAAGRQEGEGTTEVLPRPEPSTAHSTALAGTKCRLDFHADELTPDTDSGVIHRLHSLGGGPEGTALVRSRRRSQNQRKQAEDDPTPQGASMPEMAKFDNGDP